MTFPGASLEVQLATILRLFKQGELTRALSACEAGLESHPAEPRLLLQLAAIQDRLGRRTLALASLRRCAAIQAGDPAALLAIVRALQNMGEAAQADHLLRELSPDEPSVALAAARNRWRLGQYAAAREEFMRAAWRWPERAELVVAQVRMLLRCGELDLASQMLERARGRHPDHPELQVLKALLHLDQGRADLACAVLAGSAARSAEGASAGPEPGTLHAALELLTGGAPGAAKPASLLPTGDPHLAESFRWVLEQNAAPRWFGTSTGLLRWAAMESLPAGLVVECGVYHGFSINLLAAWTGREIHGFDSFQGLPEDWKPGEPAGSYSTDGRMPAVAERVSLHPGWFEDTLPAFARRLEAPVALLHVDCDLYSSTACVLEHLGPRIAAGGMIVFDDLLSFAGYRDHEFRAAAEFFAARPGTFRLEAAVLLGRATGFRAKNSAAG